MTIESQACPRCGAPMIKRSGRYGPFWGCSEYPQCKQTMRIRQERTTITRRPFIMRHDPSPYQKAIFEFVKNAHGHGVVQAVAGSGKTTTILAALQYTNSSDKVAFLAFNKGIAETLQERAPEHVHVSTLHSLGFRNIRRVYRRVKVDNSKVYKAIRAKNDDDLLHDARAIERLISLVKATLSDQDDRSLDLLANQFDVDVNGSAKKVYQAVRKIFKSTMQDTSCLDFDDMIYWCIAKPEISCQKFDFLFVDETQDLNASQLDMVLKSITSTGRILAVGDPYQSIYGFRGADVHAMEKMIDALQAQIFPLSVSYRCPKKVISLAQGLVPHIQAADNAIEGELESVDLGALDRTLKDGDFVLCRRNAPLIAVAYRLLAQGIKITILGRDIGASIIALIDKVLYKTQCAHDVVSFENALDQYIAHEVERMERKNQTMRIANLIDKSDVIHVLCDGSDTIEQVKQTIERIFSDNTTSGITFSTGHKAKGLENDRIFLLLPNEFGSSAKCTNEDQVQQELNLAYVAYTRSKKALYFVQ